MNNIDLRAIGMVVIMTALTWIAVFGMAWRPGDTASAIQAASFAAGTYLVGQLQQTGKAKINLDGLKKDGAV